jgi:peroxiredoxin
MFSKVLIHLIFVLTFYTSSYSQRSDFTLSFKIRNLPQKYEVELQTSSEKEVHRSTIQTERIDSITFKATGKLDYSVPARIVVKNRKASRYFFISPGQQSIDIHFDSLYTNFTVYGSKVNEEYLNKYIPHLAAYKLLDDGWWKQYAGIKQKFSGKIPVSVEDSLSREKKVIESLRDSLILRYVTRNPNSFVSLWKLYENFTAYGYADIYNQSYHLLNKKIRSSFDGSKLQARLVRAKELSVGNNFPFFEVVDTFGKQQSLHTQGTKYTLIDFWYSNCSPCIAQFEDFKTIHALYNTKGFQIIGISTDTKDKEMDKFQLTWSNLWDVDGKNADKYFISVFPTNFLVDHSGMIIQKNITIPELKSFLEKQLAVPNSQ